MRKNMIALVVGSLLVAGGAVAGENGYFAGLSVGSARTGLSANDVGANTLDRSDTAYKVYGGYQFNRNLAVEGSWNELGKYKATGPDESIKATALNVSVVGLYPVNGQVDVFGKAGLAHTRMAATGSSSSNDYSLGAGLRYKLDRNWEVRGEWDYFHDFADSGKNLNMYSVGAAYNF